MSAAPVVVTVPDEEYAAALADLDGVDAVVWDMEGPLERATDVRLAVMPYMTRLTVSDISVGLDSLEVVQIQSAGYEGFVDGLPHGVALCNAAGVHDASTAELALTLTLASIREIPEFLAAQRDSHWAPPAMHRALADRRVLVLGYGNIGRAVVRRFLPFEVSVTAVASRARTGDDLVDTVHGIDELPELAAGADVLVVNVARGPVVDTHDLLAECASGRLRAALDVTDPEPLPEDHGLWSTPGVLITPHVGGATEAMRPRALELIRRQVVAMRDGEPPLNVVATG